MTGRYSTLAMVLALAALAGCSSDEKDDGEQPTSQAGPPVVIELRGGHGITYEFETDEAKLAQLRKDKQALLEELKDASGRKKTRLQERIDRIASDISDIENRDSNELANRMIEILKRRIDPSGGSMEWRPMGNNRFSVRMPTRDGDLSDPADLKRP